ncbi:MAG: hypothetical protein KDK78_10010, partial [Chlamydiia bacterium]|nr:hypothetical protein [Chlamydiia bacterium]
LSHAIKEAGEMAEFSAEAVTELVETLRGNPAELDHALAREAMCQARDFSGDAVRRALERLRVR